MVKRTYGNDVQVETVRGELEAAFMAGNLEEALRLSRQMDGIQLQQLGETSC